MTHDIEWHVKHISEAWGKQIESIFETGRRLIQAKKDLGQHGKWHKMIRQQLPFSVGAAQQLMRIASHPVFTKTHYAVHLPAKWTILSIPRPHPG